MPGIAAVCRATAPTPLFLDDRFPVPAPSSRADYLRPSPPPIGGGRIFRAVPLGATLPFSQQQECPRR